MVWVRPPKPSAGRWYRFGGGWPLMARCGHRGDGGWPDLRAVTMKSLTETQCRRARGGCEPGGRTEVEDHRADSGSHLGPGMAGGRSGEKAREWGSSWGTKSAERLGRKGKSQRGGELRKMVQNGSGSHLGMTAATSGSCDPHISSQPEICLCRALPRERAQGYICKQHPRSGPFSSGLEDNTCLGFCPTG